MAAEGRKIIHMEVGEPDFDTPQPIVAAAVDELVREEDDPLCAEQRNIKTKKIHCIHVKD